MGQIQQFLPLSSEPSIVVFNTLNWKRSGLHVVFADDQVMPREREFRIVDDHDRSIPVQLVESRAEGNYWALWVGEVPPLGYITYRIVMTGKERVQEASFAPADTIQNEYFRLTLDRKAGAISSLFDRELGLELLDPKRSNQLGEFIYERLVSRRPMEELRLGEHTRSVLSGVQAKPGVDGPIWQSVVLSGSSEGFAGDDGVTCEIRMFNAALKSPGSLCTSCPRSGNSSSNPYAAVRKYLVFVVMFTCLLLAWPRPCPPRNPRQAHR